MNLMYLIKGILIVLWPLNHPRRGQICIWSERSTTGISYLYTALSDIKTCLKEAILRIENALSQKGDVIIYDVEAAHNKSTRNELAIEELRDKMVMLRTA